MVYPIDKLIALTSTGKTVKSFLDLRFGRCFYLVLYSPREENPEIMENPYLLSDDAGIKLVEYLKSRNVTSIITGEVGPKVNELLKKEKLQLVLLKEEKIKIEEVIKRISGK